MQCRLLAALTIAVSIFSLGSDALAQEPSRKESEDSKPAAEATSSPPAGDDRELVLAPLLEPGDTGDRVSEIQATLNKKLRELFPEGKIDLSSDDSISAFKESIERDYDESLIVPKIKLHDRSISLTLRHDQGDGWKILDEEHLWFQGDPIAVDGVYGEQTFATVLLFQKSMGLTPTGKVDAVTLHKLEPLVPPGWLLAKTMGVVESNDTIQHFHPITTKRATASIVIVLILISSLAVYQAARVLSNAPRFLDRWLFTESSSPWFKIFRDNKVFLRTAQFAPAIYLCLMALLIFPSPSTDGKNPFPYLNTFQNSQIVLFRTGLAYMSFVATIVALSIANSMHDMYTAGEEKDHPVEGVIRAVKRVMVVVGVVLFCAAVMGRNPMYIVGGLGALMAIIMLVFRDSLLGLVASIQILANRIVKIGDWITMPKYGADGDVQQISLTTVKVQNFDKTISTIPTHSMLSESFRNWSGMRECGGRRIKRRINIDMKSISVCTPEMIEQFRTVELLKDYIDVKEEELQKYNRDHDIEASLVNSRRLTNIGTFRAYLEAYLSNHPMLSDEMTFLVRHLQPTKEGLPIEIYAFCTTAVWKEYEAVQSDMLDHVLSILPEFGLRAFQDLTNEGEGEGEPMLPEFGELQGIIEKQNQYLQEHPNARVDVAQRRVEKEIGKLKLNGSVAVSASDRLLKIETSNHR